MLKRLGLLTVILVLMFAAIPYSLAQSEICSEDVNHLETGFNLRGRGDLTGALEHLECALQESPYDSALWMSIGQLHYQLGDTERAQYFFDHSGTGLLYFDTAIMSHTHNNSNSEQADACDTAISQFATGSQMHALGDLNRAMEAYHCALNLNPDSDAIMVQLAQVYVQMKEYEQALTYLDRALELDPYNIFYLSLRGNAHYLAGDFVAGLVDVNEVLRWNPDFASALETRDRILMASLAQQRDVGVISGVVLNTPAATPAPSNAGKDAVPQLDDSTELAVVTASETEPASPTADTLLAAAQAFVAQGRYDLAIEQYEALLGFEPNNADIHFGLGHAHYSLENYDISLPYFEQSLALAPNKLYTVYYTAMAHSQLNHRGEALAMLDELYANNQYDGSFPLVMGHVYHNLGYDDVAGIQFYQWMTARETMRLPAHLTPLTGETEVVMDYGVMYEIPFSVTAGEPIQIDVRSHILNPAPIDPLIVVLNPAGIPIAGDDDNGDLFDASLHFLPTSTATYTLVVSHAGGKHAGELDVELTGNTWAVDDYRSAAQEAFTNGQYALAIDMLNRAIAIDGGIADDYALLAKIYYMHMGDRDSAAVMLSQALQLDPTRNDLRCDLGNIYASWGNYAGAIEQYDTILSTQPNNNCALMGRNALKMREQNVSASNAIVEPYAPSAGDALYQQGLQLKENNLMFSAANAFLYATVEDPNHDRARCELAQIQLKWSNYYGAINNFEFILDRNPNDTCALAVRDAVTEKTGRIFQPMTADDFRSRAMMELEAGDYLSAIDSFKIALQLDPNDTQSRCYLGVAYDLSGNHQEAVKQWAMIADNNQPCGTDLTQSTASTASEAIVEPTAPSPADGLYEQALQYMADGKQYNAFDALFRARRVDPNHLGVWCELAKLDLAWGNYYHASEGFHFLLDRNPNDACGLEIRKAVMLGRNNMYIPTSVDDFIIRAEKYYAIDEIDLAIDSYETALDLDPTLTEVRCAVATLYTEKGNNAEAMRQRDILRSQNATSTCDQSGISSISPAISDYLAQQERYSDEILVRDVYGYANQFGIDKLYENAMAMGARSLWHEAQIRHEAGDVWTASALLDRYIDTFYSTMCKGELRWLADEYREKGYTVMADMLLLKAIADSTC